MENDELQTTNVAEIDAETAIETESISDTDAPVDLSQGANTTDAAHTEARYDSSNRNDYHRSEDTFDVFHWANEIDEVKNNVSVELFLFNKNYTPFRVRYSDTLTASVKAMFMQEATLRKPTKVLNVVNTKNPTEKTK